MSKKPDGYFIKCRLCGEGDTLQSVAMTAAWYLLHSVRQHWDMVQTLHSAEDGMVASAIASASASGWLDDIRDNRD